MSIVPRYVRTELDRAVHAFQHQFGRPPTWAAVAPGRVNLMGEHTDYNGGFVLPIAIDRACVAVGGPAGSTECSRVYSDDVAEAIAVDLRRELSAASLSQAGIARGSWGSYAAGVLAKFRPLGLDRNLDIAVASSVPLGSGLSSSAALEVAVATLAERLLGRSLGEWEKSRLCQSAEHEYAGVPCGIMDQLASVCGMSGAAVLIDCEASTFRPVRMPPGLSVVVVNSNVRHTLAGGEYSKRRAACESAARKLGVPNLRRARSGQLDARLTDEEERCVRHVTSECERALATAQAMESGELDSLGRLFAASHASLRDDFRVSCRELDVLVDAAHGLKGVVGARMTGGGFGGCVVILTRTGAEDDVQDAVLESYHRQMRCSATAFVTAAADGARAIDLSP